MGNTIDKKKLYDGYEEGYYYPDANDPVKAYKNISCNNNKCIAHLLLMGRTFKKAGHIYNIDYDSYPSFELTSTRAFVIKIVDENGDIVSDDVVCKDENGEKYFNEKIVNDVICYSKIN